MIHVRLECNTRQAECGKFLYSAIKRSQGNKSVEIWKDYEGQKHFLQHEIEINNIVPFVECNPNHLFRRYA